MRIIGVVFGVGSALIPPTSKGQYTYILDGADDAQPGDLVIVPSSENAVATIYTVDTEETYKPSKPEFAFEHLRQHIDGRYWTSREPERVRATKQARVATIQNELHKMQVTKQARLELEAKAEAGGTEGKALLAELDKLQAELAE